jgi:hypothetical protein
MKYISVDESKAKGYLLALAEIDAEKAPDFRLALNKLRSKGQSTIRFSTEDDSKKKRILKAMKALEVRWTVISVKGLSEPAARKLCLEKMVQQLEPDKDYSIVLDRDESYEAFDRRTIRDELLRKALSKSVQYRHDEPNLEKLLWLPDAIAWTYAKGGNWRRELHDFKITVIEIET